MAVAAAATAAITAVRQSACHFAVDDLHRPWSNPRRDVDCFQPSLAFHFYHHTNSTHRQRTCPAILGCPRACSKCSSPIPWPCLHLPDNIHGAAAGWKGAGPLD
jgi:hypothetical protein